MRERIPSQSVDLIYLDPPFKSDQNYNLIYKTMTGKPVPEQAEAFCDTWDMDAEKEELARRIPQLMAENGVEDYSSAASSDRSITPAVGTCTATVRSLPSATRIGQHSV